MERQRLGRGRAISTADDVPTPAARKRTTPRSARRGQAQGQGPAPTPSRALQHDQHAYADDLGSLKYEEREHVMDVFGAMDRSGRGYLPMSSLPELLDALELLDGDDDGDEIPVEWMADIDPDQTNKITLDALLHFVSMRYAENAEQQMRSAFRLFKPDAVDVYSERITLEDLQRVSAHLGEHISDSELRDMIEFIDSSNRGGVDFSDFKRMIYKTGLF
ncbi:hypothetical protein LPJ56_005112 [Coemansia sp. RSA 2599]|nr:hypothetical protein LPJ75_005038 [Coemansia sp. RSA 2598]KAJ1813615.1 hypothetical protein LPJ56_005112 [Coemansia sp. RSA 2599]